ncbi:helix-turn-helix domain-containing protein [Parapedobacter koreensis]|uniref:Helix-turn-helix domain-containing protein n=1 Tax=Parapedobacter koreensis TaxID=332977 RepID=A0A1H7MRW6_9SPHI|nr:helix-turn-helix domain-containing protein [Parapedobacter koreensis]SEL13548.1 Helix-turn-helix domain-containing protein [Parapedobacter koreensis]
MIYNQVKPHPDLLDFIDAFWTVEGVGKQCDKEIILPDGCVDLIVNLGEEYKADDGIVTMHPEKAYLVGTMTTFKETFVSTSNRLLGIRFKPAAFSSFYGNYVSMDEITDKTIEFTQSISPDIHKIKRHPIPYLNAYFLNRLSDTRHNLSNVIRDVQTAGGQISIDSLAKRNHTTVRQLERSFKQYIGVSPKEFVNIVRFKTALSKIKRNKQQQSLLDIAVDCGYYDHAHLTNAIKRYTGTSPSLF